jgi:hypothetical protein
LILSVEMAQAFLYDISTFTKKFFSWGLSKISDIPAGVLIVNFQCDYTLKCANIVFWGVWTQYYLAQLSLGDGCFLVSWVSWLQRCKSWIGRWSVHCKR